MGLATTSLSMTFWGEAFTTTASIINVLRSFTLNYDNPYHMLFNKQPNYNFFKFFCCACYPLLRPYNTHKLDFLSSLSMFIGYSLGHKGYLCLSPTGKTYISRHVFFMKLFFLFPHISLLYILWLKLICFLILHQLLL